MSESQAAWISSLADSTISTDYQGKGPGRVQWPTCAVHPGGLGGVTAPACGLHVEHSRIGKPLGLPCVLDSP